MITEKIANKLLIKLVARPRRGRTVNRWKDDNKFIN